MLCFTLDSVNYKQQTGTSSNTQLVQISNKLKGGYRFGYNGQEKVDEIAGAGNHNTAEFWEYDTRLARRWNRDPVTHEWESSYSTFGGNPIRNNDINGDDWYKNNNNSIVFNPKVHSQNDIEKTQKYLGPTYHENLNGEVDYRKDGSIMFSNEKDAYKRMWNICKEPGGGTKSHEVMGAILNNGVLVLPDYLNDATTSETSNVGYNLSNGTIHDPLSKRNIPLLATIHTHQLDLGDNGASDPPSYEDRILLRFKTPNKPYLTMGSSGLLYARWGDKFNDGEILLPKGYQTVKDLLRGASLINLFKSNLKKSSKSDDDAKDNKKKHYDKSSFK
jgi:hypothetical protein